MSVGRRLARRPDTCAALSGADDHRVGVPAWFGRIATAIAFNLATSPASPQFSQYSGFSDVAAGLSAYERTRDRCFYEPVVGKVLDEYDRLMEQSSQSSAWRYARRSAERDAPLVSNFGNNLMAMAPGAKPNPDGECAMAGLTMMYVLFAAMVQAPSAIDEVFGRESKRLIDGGGRRKASSETPPTTSQTPDRPTSEPGTSKSAAVIPQDGPKTVDPPPARNPSSAPARPAQVASVSPFAGLWAKSEAECQDEDGPNSRTLIELDDPKTGPLFDQYENHCRINRVAAGNPLQLTMTCYEFWEYFTKREEGSEQQAYITPMANGTIKINGERFQRCAIPKRRQTGQAATPTAPTAAACQERDVCGPKPGVQTWACPDPSKLALQTDEAKRQAKCRSVTPYYAGEVAAVDQGIATFPNRLPFEGYKDRLFIPAKDLRKLDLGMVPTPANRGWCRPGDWCLTSEAALFCREKDVVERITALPGGEPRRTAATSEPTCRVVGPGNVLKLGQTPATDDPYRAVPVEHPVLGSGWTGVNAFRIVSDTPPVRTTSRIGDFVVEPAKGPDYHVVSLAAQGSERATAALRSGAVELKAYCRAQYDERERPDDHRDCLKYPEATLRVRANCKSKAIWLNDREYRLQARPKDEVDFELNGDRNRRWLFRDVAGDEWLNGSTGSGEALVMSAFDTVCPGVNPDAKSALVYVQTGNRR